MLIKENPAFIQSYLEDTSNLKGGHAEKVFLPESIEDISSILQNANSKRTPVTVSGAGTGQAGGRIPFGGIVLSLEKLNQIKTTEKTDSGGFAACQAGVLIKDLKASCEHEGLLYAYDPTEQTAFLGGTIATNASGARSFKYGPTRAHVNAIKIVLADGAVLDLRRGVIRAKGRQLEFEANKKSYKINLPAYKMPETKNSAGFYAKDDMDLLDLFIGQEGTLGVIAEAEISLLKRPKEFFACFAFFKDEPAVWNFAREARLAQPISIEYFDSNSVGLLRDEYHNVPDFAKAAIFFEDEITDREDAVMEKWSGLLSKYGVSLDETWVSMNESAHRRFLEKRRFIPEKMGEMARRSGFPKVSTDLAVPREKELEMFEYYKRSLNGIDFGYFVFGHMGDAHLHVNMLPVGRRSYEEAGRLQLDFVKKAVSLDGTVSAEHGIGKTKKEFLKILYGEKGVKEMRDVKKALDPNLILNRGNVFDLL